MYGKRTVSMIKVFEWHCRFKDGHESEDQQMACKNEDRLRDCGLDSCQTIKEGLKFVFVVQ
jgi:hypothetical protein